MAGQKCLFDWLFKCANKSEKLIESSLNRIETVIKCSKAYGDNLYKSLERSLEEDKGFTINCHKSCVSTYTSKEHVQRHLKRVNQEKPSSSIPRKKTRLSSEDIFSFQRDCLFCGELCVLEKDKKNPERWKPAYLCREVKDKSLKQSILEMCDEREDEWATSVRIRVQGAISDLHAADARYHVQCKAKFMTNMPGSKPKTKITDDDKALITVLTRMEDDKSHIWNSVELFDLYKGYGGSQLSKTKFLNHMSHHFGKDLLVFSSAGVASLLVFRSKASDAVTVIDEGDQSDLDSLDIAISKVSERILQEINDIKSDRTHYDTHINFDKVLESVSDTFLELMKALSPKLDKSLPAILIGSMITSVLANTPTSLQVALGVLIRDSKELINQMHSFGVTCSYNEILRFRKSAAMAATELTHLSGISSAESGLVQVVADNFDTDISSPNGKLSTHSLAVLMTQKAQINESSETEQIRCIKWEEMSTPIKYEMPIERYNGPKKPEMPETFRSNSVLPLKILVHKYLANQRANENDLAFFLDVTTKPASPEFNGYNTAMSREQGHTVQPKTKAAYLPLIDMTPSDPDTIMTALARAQQLTKETGQKFTVFTCDLQLYRVALFVI